ncbi:hypothetical protein DL96DRAFT_1617281 [Flagelloscypha sp. PMI_526]|nr:hypothetical protein DL96DRAFT_1617281 [Flagelloscypha sp. PMI_526]
MDAVLVGTYLAKAPPKKPTRKPSTSQQQISRKNSLSGSTSSPSFVSVAGTRTRGGRGKRGKGAKSLRDDASSILSSEAPSFDALSLPGVSPSDRTPASHMSVNSDEHRSPNNKFKSFLGLRPKAKASTVPSPFPPSSLSYDITAGEYGRGHYRKTSSETSSSQSPPAMYHYFPHPDEVNEFQSQYSVPSVRRVNTSPSGPHKNASFRPQYFSRTLAPSTPPLSAPVPLRYAHAPLATIATATSATEAEFHANRFIPQQQFPTPPPSQSRFPASPPPSQSRSPSSPRPNHTTPPLERRSPLPSPGSLSTPTSPSQRPIPPATEEQSRTSTVYVHVDDLGPESTRVGEVNGPMEFAAPSIVSADSSWETNSLGSSFYANDSDQESLRTEDYSQERSMEDSVPFRAKRISYNNFAPPKSHGDDGSVSPSDAYPTPTSLSPPPPLGLNTSNVLQEPIPEEHPMSRHRVSTPPTPVRFIPSTMSAYPVIPQRAAGAPAGPRAPLPNRQSVAPFATSYVPSYQTTEDGHDEPQIFVHPVAAEALQPAILVRQEYNEGSGQFWKGEWNQRTMDDVIEKLRALR